MLNGLRVLFIASEADPLVKIGGLGDVAGSLPKALCNLPPEPGNTDDGRAPGYPLPRGYPTPGILIKPCSQPPGAISRQCHICRCLFARPGRPAGILDLGAAHSARSSSLHFGRRGRWQKIYILFTGCP